MKPARFQPGRIVRSVLLTVAAGGLVSGCSAPDGVAPPTISAVRVQPFDVRGPIDLPDFVGRAIAESLGRHLESLGDVEVVDPSRPDSPGTATLTGIFEQRDVERCIELQARVADRDTPLWSLSRCSAAAAIPDLIEDAAGACLEKLGRQRRPLYPYIARVEGGAMIAGSPLLADARDRLQRGDANGAVEAAGALVAAFPDEASALVIRAWATTLAWDAEPTEANLAAVRDDLLALSDRDPSSPYDDLLQAFVYRSSGAPGEARQLYSRVLDRHDLTPSARAWVLRQRSYTYQQAGEDEAALRDAEQAVRLDPAQPLGLVALSRALESLGRLDEALRRSTEAVALEPNSWRHVQRVGIVALRAGNYDRATDYLRRACEMSESQEGCSNLAVGLQRADRRDEALAVAERAETLTATRWGEYNLACLWALRGNRRSALAALRNASSLGFADVLIATDPDLDALRGDVEFEREVARVLDRVRARRGLATAVFPWLG